LASGTASSKTQAEKTPEREAVAKLVFGLIVREIVERLRYERLEDHPFTQGLRPAELLRAASLVRSPPLISAAFGFGRKASHGISAAIATSGSFLAARPS
jgi:hypothetical protein